MSSHPSSNGQKQLRQRRRTVIGLIVVVAGYFAAMIGAQRSRLALGTVPLQAITTLSIILMLVVLFVLGRNVIKLYVERRRQKLGSQFSTRVVVTYIGMALVPTVMLFVAASGLISDAVDYWFSPETTLIVEQARQVALEAQQDEERELQRMAAALADVISRGYLPMLENWQYLRNNLLRPQRVQLELDAILVYEGDALLLDPVFDTTGAYADLLGRPATATASPPAATQPPEAPAANATAAPAGGDPAAATAATAAPAVEPLPSSHPLAVPAAQIALASQGQPFRFNEPIDASSRLLRAGVPIRDRGNSNVVGVLVVARFMDLSLAGQVSGIEANYASFQQGLDSKELIKNSYLSTFLLMTLLILFSALWVGLYLARGVTGPIQKLAEGTRAVASGDLTYRVEVDARDELGTLVESFNQMTEDLRAGSEKLRQSRDSLQASNTELDERRRYMEAMLANIATGVISLNAEGEITTFNRAAERMLEMDAPSAIGQRFENALGDDNLADLRELMQRAKARRAPLEDELSLEVNGSRLTVAAHCSSLRDSAGAYMGTVVVLDDLTELITAQKTAAWREVARRIAHEIRNPLTPIQLSAQRIARRYRRAAGAEGHFDVIEEGTRTILQEVDTLKGLVSEFSRYARMPTVSLVPSSLHDIIENGLLACASMHEGISVERQFSRAVPSIKADPDQLKRAFTNLFDNAVEAMEGEGTLRVSTSFDPDIETARIEVADTGPGIKPEDKDRLFLPYFSRKRDGTGLGLAIVHQIVADHSGYVKVSDNRPRGTVFTIELPC
jgi:two-component system nitrogen regulation sensor histidine kinase NtrY